MTTITTRRHPIKFYTILLFVSLLLCALGTIIMLYSIDILQKGQPTIKQFLMPVYSLAIYVFVFSIVYTYWRKSPKITVDKHIIRIDDQTFYLRDIKDIKLLGKMPFHFIMSIPMESTTILFNDGTEKILFDDMYSNSSDLKLFLEQVFFKKQDFKPALKNQISINEIQFENEETFKGNQFTSLRGISLWGLIGFFTLLLFSEGKTQPVGLIFFGAFGIFWFITHSWLMHYFGLTKKFLIIKNHNFFWKLKIYRLSDIKEIVFETQGKLPNCLRVITNDYRNNLYPAGTLRDKMWLNFKVKLETKGLIVRNECIF